MTAQPGACPPTLLTIVARAPPAAAVGIDRIIAEAGVAKATFYHHFPAKDELVRAYVQGQSQLGQAAIDRLSQRSPRDMVLAISTSSPTPPVNRATAGAPS